MDDAEKIAAALIDELQRLADRSQRVTWAELSPGTRALTTEVARNLLGSGTISTRDRDDENRAIVIGFPKGLGPAVTLMHQASEEFEQHHVMVWDLRIEAAGPAVDKMDIALGAPVGYKKYRTPFYEALQRAVSDAVVKTLEEHGA